MRAHRVARAGRVPRLDRRVDPFVLALDGAQIGDGIGQPIGLHAHAEPRDREAPQIFEKPAELGIAGGGRHGAMEGEILVDRRPAPRDGALHGRERPGNIALGLGPRPLGGEAGRLDLHRHPQLHHVHHLGDRGQAVGIDAKRPALPVTRDEEAETLARDDQPLGPQRGQASRSTGRLTPNAATIACSVGSRPPRAIRPLVISSVSRNLGIGLLTPPVGSTLFVGCAVGGVTMEQAVRKLWPFYLVLLAVLALVTYVPIISLWLPQRLHL